jgi:hypothetical protein
MSIMSHPTLPASLGRARACVGAALVVAIAAVARSGAAQEYRSGLFIDQPRDVIDIAGAWVQPRGDFRRYVGGGGALDGAWIHGLDRAGIVGLRVEGGYIIYGSRTRRYPAFGGLISVDVNTNNNIAFFGIGPQLMLPGRRARPYVAATGGFAYFFTQSSVEGSSNNTPFAQTTNFSDGTWAATGLAGLYIPLGHGNTPIALDLGARYHSNGQASYLTESSITDNGNSTVSIAPIHSEANLVTWRAGITIGVR